jgi:hypothetical protein|nr:MAG TPA: Putative transferase, nesg, ydcK, Structural Genomics.38A [Caudoviricetes sp.]
MGLKKYEIITVGSDKRVRALRSWAVGDRYVNIGDVGGIVYDEKTLSQDGACWLFRGNFGFPGARIGGDSIVDVGEVTLPDTGTPNVDILGSSVVVGSKLRFTSDQTVADAVVLTAADFEQGGFNPRIVGNPLTGSDSPIYIRTKNPIFAGGKTVTLKCEVPGYSVQAFVLDRDGLVITGTLTTATGAGVAITVPAGQYFSLMMTKAPADETTPADATAAQITFTGTYETKLSVIDSRVEINPATATGMAIIKPGGIYAISPGAKYPEAIIRNSNMSIIVPASANRIFRLMGQVIRSPATLDATAGEVAISGSYSNIKNLTASGILPVALDVRAYNIIQAHDCDNFVVSPTIFPGLAAAQTANMPFIFQGCNVPNGIFYHHAQVANTYKNIDFAKAQADLGKAIASGEILASSEVEGMYRAYSVSGTVFGGLVEGYDSVKSLNMAGTASSYGTTIYKDAYFTGLFDFAGTNVFGNKVRSHQLAQVLNVQPRAVQGEFNTRTTGQTVTGVAPSTSVVSIATPFRVAGGKGLTVLTPPAGLRVLVLLTDINNKVITNTGWVSVETNLSPVAVSTSYYAYISVRKTALTDLNPSDVAGTQIVTYNGCKIVNTGETAVNMKGNIRVEDNATLVDASVVGSGYFGGNADVSGVTVEGCAYVKDNAVIVVPAGSATIRSLKMTENAYAAPAALTLNGHIWLSGNSKFIPAAAASGNGDLFMQDNAVISGSVSVSGSLTMKDNAKVSAGTLSVYGDITVCGSYNQTVSKLWTGKRVIDNENAPGYDNNVKTQYDF